MEGASGVGRHDSTDRVALNTATIKTNGQLNTDNGPTGSRLTLHEIGAARFEKTTDK